MMATINLLANVTVTIAVTLFMIGVFGRRSKTIEAMPAYEQQFLKVALAVLASGSLLNVLTVSTPHFTEVVLNVGLAMLFAWAAWFHWKYFVKKPKQ